MSRKHIDRAFNDPSYTHFGSVNNTLALLTILSVLALVLETVPSLASYFPVFHAVELVALAFFIAEYALRVFSSPKPLAYIFSFFGIIDLLAILPSLFGFTSLALKSARALRILRFLRLLRLAKLARLAHQHTKRTRDIETVYRINVGIYIFAVIMVVLAIGTAIYTAEHHEGAFASIPLGMFWALQVMVDSAAVAKPTTGIGAAIEVFARFLSFVLLGFLIHIVGNFVNAILLGTHKRVNRKDVIDGE